MNASKNLKSGIFLCLCAAAFAAIARTEISWSIMHPTAIDTKYMKRVAQKAVEYGGVDSFEVCGDCHDAASGINGLSMLNPYPKAHAHVDPAAVEKNRREMNAICNIAHSVGRPLYYWHREIYIPKGLLEDLPGLLDADGEFDLLGETYQNWLRFKLDETFRYCPSLDGIVLTLTEADFSVIHNSNPKRYPPQKVVERLVGLFAEEIERRGKRFILRSFGSNSQDYIDIIGGAVMAAKAHGFEIETKVTEADFVPWLPTNPFLERNAPLTLGAECDALGEYLGAGYLPAAQVDRIREYVIAARDANADRFAIRIDRVGNSIFDSAHEINLYAYMRFIRDSQLTADEVIAEYAARRFGAAKAEMIPLVKGELEMVRDIHYVASNLTFHSFPLRPGLKWIKAGGIFSLYRENASLAGTKDLWGILSEHLAPTHERILAEKAEGLRLAQEGLRTIRSLRGKLPPDEYARQLRAFVAAETAARTIAAYTACVVAYFQDMADARDEPKRLQTEIAKAVREITGLMKNPKDEYEGGTGYFATAGDNLDRVYAVGLRADCRLLTEEYAAERAVRKALEARPDVVDFVVPGGIYDDVRTIRTMHGAHAELKGGVPVRWVGNPVFPNGTVTVEFKDVPDAKVEVELDPAGAADYTLGETAAGGVRTVVIGKKGAAYPAVRSIALVKPAK